MKKKRKWNETQEYFDRQRDRLKSILEEDRRRLDEINKKVKDSNC